jgi:hypothetical protein
MSANRSGLRKPTPLTNSPISARVVISPQDANAGPAFKVSDGLAMVFTGLYPTGSVKQVFAIVVGTALAALFALYMAQEGLVPKTLIAAYRRGEEGRTDEIPEKASRQPTSNGPVGERGNLLLRRGELSEGDRRNVANDALVAEMLDLIVNDSENLERTMNLLTDDAVWVLEPGGIEYHGARDI